MLGGPNGARADAELILYAVELLDRLDALFANPPVDRRPRVAYNALVRDFWPRDGRYENNKTRVFSQ